MSQKTYASKVTVGRQLGALVGVMLLLPLIAEIFVLQQNKKVAQMARYTAETILPSTRNMGMADMMHDGLRSVAYRAIVLSGSKDTKEIESTREELVEFTKQIQEHLKAVHDAPLPEKVIEDAKVAMGEVDGHVGMAKRVVDTALAGQAEQAIAKLKDFNEEFEKLEKSLAVLGEDIEKIGEETERDAQVITARVETISHLIMGVNLLVGMLLGWAIARSLRRRLNQVVIDLGAQSEKLFRTSGALSESTTSLESATTEQSSALQETAASIDEITAMVKKTGENAKLLSGNAEQSQRSVDAGQQAVGEMRSAIGSISESNERIMAQIEDGNRQIGDIVKVIGDIGAKTKVINDIVFQTKLLSFNASVEAARAGEHGKGFAVVAEEVGNLAQMSGNAAKEISDMLEASMSRVQSIVDESQRRVAALITEGKEKIRTGSETAVRCGAAFEEIVKQSSGVSAMTAEIASAIQEQTQGIDEISRALGMMNQSTQINSQTTQKTAAAATELSGDAASLRDVVTMLEAYVGGRTAAEAGSDKPKSGRDGDSDSRGGHGSSVVSIETASQKRRARQPQPEQDTRQVLKKAVGAGPVPDRDDPRFEDV